MNRGGTDEINQILIMCLILKVHNSGKVKFRTAIATRFKGRTAGNAIYRQVSKKTIIFKICKYLDVRTYVIVCVRILFVRLIFGACLNNLCKH
jgi:hypothetical protein